MAIESTQLSRTILTVPPGQSDSVKLVNCELFGHYRLALTWKMQVSNKITKIKNEYTKCKY